MFILKHHKSKNKNEGVKDGLMHLQIFRCHIYIRSQPNQRERLCALNLSYLRSFRYSKRVNVAHCLVLLFRVLKVWLAMFSRTVPLLIDPLRSELCMMSIYYVSKQIKFFFDIDWIEWTTTASSLGLLVITLEYSNH